MTHKYGQFEGDGRKRALPPVIGAPEEKRMSRPAECPASGAGHRDGPNGPHGEQQCAYCGLPPDDPPSICDRCSVEIDSGEQNTGPEGSEWQDCTLCNDCYAECNGGPE